MLDPRDDPNTANSSEELNALAARLQTWRPSAGGLDRDRLIFESGRAAGLAEARAMDRGRLWPMATAASLLLAVGFYMARGPEKGGEPERIDLAVKSAEVPRSPQPIAESAPIAPIDPSSYLALARQFASGDLDPIQAEPVRPSDSNRSSPPVDRPPPLRARDFDRLLNL
jgi:hypothetical protein